MNVFIFVVVLLVNVMTTLFMFEGGMDSTLLKAILDHALPTTSEGFSSQIAVWLIFNFGVWLMLISLD